MCINKIYLKYASIINLNKLTTASLKTWNIDVKNKKNQIFNISNLSPDFNIKNDDLKII
jgi:hypothetical protein